MCSASNPIASARRAVATHCFGSPVNAPETPKRIGRDVMTPEAIEPAIFGHPSEHGGVRDVAPVARPTLMDPLDRLPHPADRRLAARVTADAIRHVRSGHPWVFGDSVVHITAEGAAGDLAVIFDSARKFVAIGLYDPTSPIRIRVLHHGSPVPIDDAWWSARLDAALDRRIELAGSSDTTGYRCINGENDGFPGLVLDRYDASYVLKLYSTAWLPHLRMLVELLGRRLAPDALILRLSRGVQRGQTFGLADGLVLIGDAPEQSVLFRENGLTFEADLVRGQKTGHFLDQRENRARVRSLAAGADVLDVFACTGGFSVHAAAGGARRVHSIDLSAPTLAIAERNMAHNRHLPRRAGMPPHHRGGRCLCRPVRSW